MSGRERCIVACERCVIMFMFLYRSSIRAMRDCLVGSVALSGIESIVW